MRSPVFAVRPEKGLRFTDEPSHNQERIVMKKGTPFYSPSRDCGNRLGAKPRSGGCRQYPHRSLSRSFCQGGHRQGLRAGRCLKETGPGAPMPGHFIVLRHMDGDDWDFCVIEHLGTKTTIEAARPAPPRARWHSAHRTPILMWPVPRGRSSPSKWASMTLPSRASSAYVVSVYRPAPGQREALDKFLNEPPDRTTDTSSGNVVLQHLEGAAWTFSRSPATIRGPISARTNRTVSRR